MECPPNITAGDYLIPANLPKHFWLMYNNWNLKYWRLLFIVTVCLYTGFHVFCRVFLYAARADLFTRYLSGSVFLGSLSLLLGFLFLSNKRLVAHSHTIVLVSISLVFLIEVYAWTSMQQNLYIPQGRVSIICLLSFLFFSCRIFPGVAYILGVSFLVFSACYFLVSASAGNTAQRLQLASGIVFHWFTLFVGVVCNSWTYSSESELIGAITDRLETSSAGNFRFWGLEDWAISYFRKNWRKPVVLKFPDPKIELAFQSWNKRRTRTWLLRHAKWVLVGNILHLLGVTMVGFARIHAYDAIIVQVSSGVLLLLSTIFALVHYSFPNRLRWLIASGITFLLGCGVFSTVFAYVFDSSFIDDLKFTTLISPWDPLFFMVISSHVLFDSWIIHSFVDALILTSTILCSLYWLESMPEYLAVICIQIAFLATIGVIYRISLTNTSRLIFCLTFENGDKDDLIGGDLVKVIGYNMEFSSLVTLYQLELGNRKIFLSAKAIREKMYRSGWGYQIDPSFDCLSEKSADISIYFCNRFAQLLQKIIREEHRRNGISSTNNKENMTSAILSNIFPFWFDGDQTTKKTRDTSSYAENDKNMNGSNILGKEATINAFNKFIPCLNISVITVGSYGDIQPFIALCKQLNDFGHKCRLITHEKFQISIEQCGIDFYPLALLNQPGHWQPEDLMKHAETHPRIGPGLLFEPKNLLGIVSNAQEMKSTLESLLLPLGWESGRFGPWKGCVDLPSHKSHAIIANPPSMSHIHVAEKLGIPCHMMFTMPWSCNDKIGHPLCVSDSESSNPFWNHMSYRWVDALVWMGSRTCTNKFRKSIGLRATIHGENAGILLHKWSVPFAYCFSELLMPRPVGWGSNIDITGFIKVNNNLSTEAYQPPQVLWNFLSQSQENRPFYIGFGSICTDLSDLFNCIIQSIKEFPDKRFILHRGWCQLSSFDLRKIPKNVFIITPPPAACPSCIEGKPSDSNVYCDTCNLQLANNEQPCWEKELINVLGDGRVCLLKNIPHEWLFKYCSGVMHHGGAGTTACGASHGLPTIVCAFFGDQGIWGKAIESRGSGKFLFAKNASPQRITEMLRFSFQAETISKAKDLGRLLVKERDEEGDGAVKAMRAFHEQLPIELVCCELCVHRYSFRRPNVAEKYLSMFDLRLCLACCKEMSNCGNLVDLKLVEWGHSRKGILMTHLTLYLKTLGKLYKRPKQAVYANGWRFGCLLGLFLALLEIIVLLISIPVLVFRDISDIITKLVKHTQSSNASTTRSSPSTPSIFSEPTSKDTSDTREKEASLSKCLDEITSTRAAIESINLSCCNALNSDALGQLH